MRVRAPGLIAALAGLALVGTDTIQGSELTLEDRVRAQERIERVYYAHQIGATASFEEAVPRAVLERKVRTYLRQSAALEKVVSVPVTPETLKRELERIAATTRLPERLLEIYDALGRDPFLIQECFARPVLVDRLARSILAGDERFLVTPGKREGPESLAVLAARDVSLPLPATPRGGSPSALCGAAGTWKPLGGAPDERQRPATVWTGTEMIVWGGGNFSCDCAIDVAHATGGRYDPLTDSWRATASEGAPEARLGHTAVWTGSEMIVWGGSAPFPGALGTGGRYDPVADTWTPVSTAGAPSARFHHSAVWTGSQMIVWSGTSGWNPPVGPQNTGGRYDPATDQWTPTSTANAPAARELHTAVWTGSEMVIWGGGELDEWDLGIGSFVALHDTGARYDPAGDQWTPIATAGAPSARAWHTAVFTGEAMVVWGGGDHAVSRDTGGRYDLATDTWSPTSLAGAPAPRVLHSALWTGQTMVVWGGGQSGGAAVNSGGRYDPEHDTWAPTATAGAPSGRLLHGAAWTGEQVIVWGGIPSGYEGERPLGNGGRYDPVQNAWTPVSNGNVPAPRADHTAVWTGNEMIVWGGTSSSAGLPALLAGGRYDPLTDAWTPTSADGAPSVRYRHTAVWTGSEMIVWGGWGAFGGAVGPTGGRYDPIADTWTPTSTTGAPATKDRHAAVWTGSEMIVWGGYSHPVGTVATGGRYDPATDQWAATTTAGAPSPRLGHAAVWTGTEMVVWGGGSTTGGRYDPSIDQWKATTTINAPPVTGVEAVWTGTEMIVSYGYRYVPGTNTWAVTTAASNFDQTGSPAIWTGEAMTLWKRRDAGGSYFPALDRWEPTSTDGAPLDRTSHSAVWTGSEMIVWGGELFFDRYLRSGATYRFPPSVDADGDGHTCTQDCDEGDPQLWSAPGQSNDLTFAADRVTLTWSAPSGGGGTLPLTYDTLRSSSPSDFYGSGTVCLATNDPRTMAVDAAPLAPGAAFYYLVRAQSACSSGGQGPLTHNDDGAVRHGRSCP